MSEDSERMTRRTFLERAGKAGLATSLALAGVALPEEASAQDGYPSRNLSKLADYQFTGQDGKPVDVNALVSQIKGKDVTLTFGFQACTAYCPFTNGTLGALDEKAPGRFKHIVIAMQPEHDGASQSSRNNLITTIKEMMNEGRVHPIQDPKNVIILYPHDSHTSVQIEHAFDNLVGSDPRNHTPNVDVFNVNGQRIAKGVPDSIPAKGDGDLAAKAQAFASSVLGIIQGRGK